MSKQMPPFRIKKGPSNLIGHSRKAKQEREETKVSNLVGMRNQIQMRNIGYLIDAPITEQHHLSMQQEPVIDSAKYHSFYVNTEERQIDSQMDAINSMHSSKVYQNNRMFALKNIQEPIYYG